MHENLKSSQYSTKHMELENMLSEIDTEGEIILCLLSYVNVKKKIDQDV